MNPERLQRTIAQPASVSGFGYWSGADVCLEFHPAAPGAGVTFVRTDLGPGARVPARAAWRIDAPRRTNLSCGGADVDMVEHVLAALAAMRIDNCEVRVDQAEMPGCDGSARPFVEAIERAGIVTQPCAARYLEVLDAVRVQQGDCWIEARRSSRRQLAIEFRLDYPIGTGIGRQTAKLAITPESFRREIADCRTFLLASEAETLTRQGLGARVTPRDLLVFDKDGPIDNELRHPNECARHKVLDVIGDLALTGCRVVGELTAYRSGHRLNAELAEQLVERFGKAPLRASA